MANSPSWMCCGAVNTKIVHRHPHVFGDVQAASAGAVLKNWERLKAEERASQGKSEASLLAGVSLALPALLQAEQYQKRAHHVGFDWSDVQGVQAKLDEELQEVDAAVGQAEQAAEIGDLLFAVVNLARWLHLDAESALRESNARFLQTVFIHRGRCTSTGSGCIRPDDG